MKYEVINGFVDLQDDNYKYSTGDEFPRAGVDVSKDRISELASSSNKCGIALIRSIETDEPVVAIEEKSDESVVEDENIADEPVVEVEKKPKKSKNNKEK